MARIRTLSQMREEAYRKADCEGAYDRHDRADVDRDLNQGIAQFWDALIEVRGAEYLQSETPDSITTLASTSAYDLVGDFYMLVNVRISDAGGYPLTRFGPEEEPALREVSTSGGWPTHYQVRRHVDAAASPQGAVTHSLVVLPVHPAGLTLSVDYVPHAPELVNDTDYLDGANGWEDFAVCHAARLMAQRDGDRELAADLAIDKAEALARIQRVAPKRDMHQARRVKDVRGARAYGRRFPPA